MVGGQRPPLPLGEALRRRHLWKPEASPPAGRSPEALYRSYSLYIPLSMPLCFWPCLSFSFALPETNASNTADLYHMVGGQRMLSFFVSSLPAFLNFKLLNRRVYKDM